MMRSGVWTTAGLRPASPGLRQHPSQKQIRKTSLSIQPLPHEREGGCTHKPPKAKGHNRRTLSGHYRGAGTVICAFAVIYF
jgi:hypothetical protein